MHPGGSDFREKKKCERVYLPGGGPAGPPHRPESLAVFKILAAPPYTPFLEALWSKTEGRSPPREQSCAVAIFREISANRQKLTRPGANFRYAPHLKKFRGKKGYRNEKEKESQGGADLKTAATAGRSRGAIALGHHFWDNGSRALYTTF